MSRLPALKSKGCSAAARARGFRRASRHRGHYILKHPTRAGLRVTLPWHNKDLKRGTLRSVIEQAGYTIDEFVALL